MSALTRSMMVALVCVACGGDDGGAGDGDAGGRCAANADCDDGTFCNGSESCDAAAAAADGRGCVPGTPPCADIATCDETMNTCGGGCTTDSDADGVVALECGGTDCDDADPERFPGNPEVCDAAGHDEDCDATTFGIRDADGDGFPDAACCNSDGSTMNCGTDCDDTLAIAHPSEAESCDMIDNDCDGSVDEGMVMSSYHPDCDGDMYGAEGSTGFMGCDPPAAPPMCSNPSTARWADNAGDCADDRPDIHPAATQVCDAFGDNACGAAINPHDADGDGHDDEACGGPDCDDSDAATNPDATDPCDGMGDLDCDGLTEDFDGDGDLPVGSTCVGGPRGGYPRTDCDDRDLSISGTAPETCSGRDNDCDGSTDEDPEASASCGPTSSCSFGTCVGP